MGMVANYTESLLKNYGIKNPIWYHQNKKLVHNVEDKLKKLKSRMHSGLEFRKIPAKRVQKYCGKEIEQFDNYFAGTIITDQVFL